MPDQLSITIFSTTPVLSVTALRGDTAPVTKSGYGGWVDVARQRRKSITEWQGIGPMRETLPLLFDGYRTDTSVEPGIAILEQLAQPVGVAEPPVVRVLGAIPHPDIDWVIEDLEWDDQPLYSTNGYRVRHGVIVHLLEYVDDDRVQLAGAAERTLRAAQAAQARTARATSGVTAGAPRRYRVKAGDTLPRIAAAMLGSSQRWHEIADLNGLRDTRSLTVGQEIRLP